MPRMHGAHDDSRRGGAATTDAQLADALAQWSLAPDHPWTVEAVPGHEPFLRIDGAPPRLASELAALHDEGYVMIGPTPVPCLWLADAERYRRDIRLITAHVLTLTQGSEPVYVPKVAGEIEPLVELWPFVLLIPTSRTLGLDHLMRSRAWPVHPLGVADGVELADGGPRSPAEFFAHDLDHARFKIREDLLARGIDLPDAYVDGSTYDPTTGHHRTVMDDAAAHVGAEGWQSAAGRAAMIDRWLDAIHEIDDRDLATATRWLLFELVHEKSLPIHGPTLLDALASGAHVTKLRRKCESGFYGAFAPDPAAVAVLDVASTELAAMIG